jgi:hypothetical protein
MILTVKYLSLVRAKGFRCSESILVCNNKGHIENHETSNKPAFVEW